MDNRCSCAHGMRVKTKACQGIQFTHTQYPGERTREQWAAEGRARAERMMPIWAMRSWHAGTVAHYTDCQSVWSKNIFFSQSRKSRGKKNS